MQLRNISIFEIYRHHMRLILMLIICCAVDTFVLEITSKGIHCYRSEQNSEKTLLVRFSFPRTTPQGCKVELSIGGSAQSQKDHVIIHRHTYRCEDQNMRNGQEVVVKHGSESDDYDSYYFICVDVLETSNPVMYLSLAIGEVYDPEMFEDSEEMPYIATKELIIISSYTHVARTSLERSRIMASKAQQEGQTLNAQVKDMLELSRTSSLIQMGLLILFGVGWVTLLRGAK